MSAFNVVRFRVKPGRDQEFLAAHRRAGEDPFPGAQRIALIKTGDGAYCIIGEWDSLDHIVGARPRMISLLDTFRDCLEDLGGNLGVTDPVSGVTVFEKTTAPKASRKASAKKKAAPKRAKSKARAKPARKPAKKAPARKPAKKRR